jgi:hypothetical protein
MVLLLIHRWLILLAEEVDDCWRTWVLRSETVLADISPLVWNGRTWFGDANSGGAETVGFVHCPKVAI